MQSKAKTVDQYLAQQPADRRAILSAVREVILKNLDADYEEGMRYGMIGYYVPDSVIPADYYWDPKHPLTFIALAAQKNYFSLYMMSPEIACCGAPREEVDWFERAWQVTGKKLDRGKSCLRFKRLEDLPLDVIGEAIRRVPVKKYLDSRRSP